MLCAGKSLPPQIRALAREFPLFSALLLLFAVNCGNIIRQYCFAAEYALVAQPVEHLTFNQRARDSSSLERTKEKPTIHRFKCGLDRGFLFVISARRGLKSATEMRQLQRGCMRTPERVPEGLIKIKMQTAGGPTKTIFTNRDIRGPGSFGIPEFLPTRGHDGERLPCHPHSGLP